MISVFFLAILIIAGAPGAGRIQKKFSFVFAMEVADEIFLQASKCRKMGGLGVRGNLSLSYPTADRKGNGVRLGILVWGWGVTPHKHISA